MGEHHTVATAVAVGYQLALLHVGHRLNDAAPFLGSVTVGTGKTSRQPAVGIHLHLGGEYGHIPVLEPRLDPVDDTRCHHQHLIAVLEGGIHGLLRLGTRQRGLIVGSELSAQGLKLLLRHPFDKVADEPFLGLAATQQS